MSTILTVVEDTYVVKSGPTQNHGGKNYVLATSGENTGFLKFDTSIVPQGSTVESVYLELYTTNITAGEPGVVVNPVTSDWNELELTFNTMPVADTTITATSVDVPVKNNWVGIDLDPTTVNVGDFTSYQIKYKVSNSNFQFSSKEGAHPPQLTLTVSEQSQEVKTINSPSIADTFVVEPRPYTPHSYETTASATTGNTRAYVKFDTSILPADSELVEARVLLYTSQLYTDAPGIELRLADTSWSESDFVEPEVSDNVVNEVVLPNYENYTEVKINDIESINLEGETGFQVKYSEPDSGFEFATRQSTNPPLLVLAYVSTNAAPEPPDGPEPPTNDNLPFNLADTATLRASNKKVFAHYFPPYPISFDNDPPAEDYYTRNYLNPDGEGGKHSAYGGFFRDRPIGRQPLSGDYKAKDFETEVRQAIKAGIDGFAIDILSLTSENWTRTVALTQAALRVDPGFQILIQPDMTTLNDETPQALANGLQALSTSPNAAKLPDGRLVISPFKGENVSVSYWEDFFDAMQAHGHTVAFWPVFLDWKGNIEEYAPISYGASAWGDRSPSSNDNIPDDVDYAHSFDVKWMQAVSTQDNRPSGGSYYESQNLENLRMCWTGSIDGGADWVLLPTWNDYSEATSFAPTQNHGTVFLDVSSYYLHKFKLGNFPPITRGGIYVTHRIQNYDSTPTYPQTEFMILRTSSSPARNTVEVMGFFTAATTVKIYNNSFNYDAGVSWKTTPLQLGTVTVEVNGTTYTSPYTVVEHNLNQNLEYHAISALTP